MRAQLTPREVKSLAEAVARRWYHAAMPPGKGHLPHRLMNSKASSVARVGADYAGFTRLMYCITTRVYCPVGAFKRGIF